MSNIIMPVASNGGPTRTSLIIPGVPQQFGGKVHLFGSKENYKINEKQAWESFNKDNIHDPYQRRVKLAIKEALTQYGQFGCYDEDGAFDPSRNTYLEDAVRRGMLKESGGSAGFITPDKTPFLFDTTPIIRETTDEVPDTSFVDFMVSTRMEGDIETREEWEFGNVQYVLMKGSGQVKYSGQFVTRMAVMTAEEYGAGIEISWRWFETNKFRITMARLAPKFKFAAFDQQAEHVYNVFVAAATNTLTTYGGTATNKVVRDINAAIGFFRRYKQTWNGRYPFENRSFRIIAPPEAFWILDPIINPGSYQFGAIPERVNGRINVSYTTKLNKSGTVPYVIYVVVDKWEQNEFATSIPLEAHGPEDDITTFATKMTFRMGYGVNIDPNSIIKLTFDPTLNTFAIFGPVETRAVV